MARGGATPADWPALVAAALAAQAAGNVTIAGIWSHLACADIPGHPSVAAQLARFTEAVALAEAAGARPEVRHLANTAAALTCPDTWFDLVRPGGAIYGLATLPGRRPGLAAPGHDGADPAGAGQAGPGRHPGVLRPPLHHPGREHPGADPARLRRGNPAAVRPGWSRSRPAAGAGASPAPCAWTCPCSTSAAEPAETGDEVVLFGPGDAGEPTAQEWADALGTVSYEIVTNFAGLLPRTYCGVAYENSESLVRGCRHGDGAASLTHRGGRSPAGRAAGRCDGDLAADHRSGRAGGGSRGGGGRGRRRGRADRDRPDPAAARTTRRRRTSASCAAGALTVLADDGVPLHVEIDDPPAAGGPGQPELAAAAGHHRLLPRLHAEPGLLALPAP